MGRWFEPGQGCVKKTQTRYSNGNTPCCGLRISGSNPDLVLFFVFFINCINMELKHRGKASTLSVVSFISFLFIFFYPYLPSQARDNFDFWPLSISLDNR